MSQTIVTLTCPEGRWNLISFLNFSSSILACSTKKKRCWSWRPWQGCHPPVRCCCRWAPARSRCRARQGAGALWSRFGPLLGRGPGQTWLNIQRYETLGQFLSHDILKWNFIFLVLLILLPVWIVHAGFQVQRGWWCCLVAPSLTNTSIRFHKFLSISIRFHKYLTMSIRFHKYFSMSSGFHKY